MVDQSQPQAARAYTVHTEPFDYTRWVIAIGPDGKVMVNPAATSEEVREALMRCPPEVVSQLTGEQGRGP